MRRDEVEEDVEAAQHLLKEGKEDVETARAAESWAQPSGMATSTDTDELHGSLRDSWFTLKLGVSLGLMLLFAVVTFISMGGSSGNPLPSTQSAQTSISTSTPVEVTTVPEPDDPSKTSVETVRLSGADTAGDRYLLDPAWDVNAAPQTREYHWSITDVESNPDGVYRPMLFINNDFPGPLIEVNEGDIISVHVHNLASNATAIHWHGLFQNGTNHMDGTVGITQCPIAPGKSFVYTFKAEGQSGTYWYHAHHGTQASDGLYGPIIIHSKEEAVITKQQGIPYASDRVLMVSDHYYDLSGVLLYQYLQPDRENIEPVPASALINGRGWRDCADPALSQRKCSDEGLKHPVIQLKAGENHRLRIINAAGLAEFQIQLDEHEFAVTEADGTDLVPRNYHRLNILSAQRYSIVVSANHTDRDSFMLRSRMVQHCFGEENTELTSELFTYVQYTSDEQTAPIQQAPDSKDWPETIEMQCRDMNTSELVPALPNPPPPKADHLIYVRSNFEIGAWRLSRGFFNTSSWRANVTSPTLFRYLDGANANNPDFTNPFPLNQPEADTDPGAGITVPSAPQTAGINNLAFSPSRELIYQTNGTQTIDILISNFDDGAHPFHLHGHKFWVLAGGKGYPPAELVAPSNLNYGLGEGFPGTGPSHPDRIPGVNLKDPLYRDTATVESFGWALFRFRADNPGLWAFHCHISWHTEAGLLMQFLVRGDELRHLNVPQEMRDMCHDEGVERGRGPDDSIWFGSFPD